MAFLGILTIKKHLTEVEEKIAVKPQEMTTKTLYSHFKKSLLALKQFPVVVELLLISVFGQVILSSLLPMATLLLMASPFYSLATAQSIAMLSVVLFLGSVLGNMLSGSYCKQVSTKAIIMISQLTRLTIILGFFCGSYLLVLVSSFFCAVTVGIVSPRVSKLVFSLIPEEVIGTVQSGLATFSVLIPGLMTMGVIAVASTMGFKSASAVLLVIVLLVFLVLNRTKRLD